MGQAGAADCFLVRFAALVSDKPRINLNKSQLRTLLTMSSLREAVFSKRMTLMTLIFADFQHDVDR